jgi:DNA-3-methyladenine glycosylase
MILARDFYIRQVQTVAQDLLGRKLVRMINGCRVTGIISETEAYDGEKDLACHARSGKTQRNRVMYGESGRAYIYFTYGIHWMLNCIAGEEGYPAAVLIRAILPVEGLVIIQSNRAPIPEKHWTDGPAKLAKALSINGDLNGVDMTNPTNGLWIEKGTPVPPAKFIRTPRIGIDNTPEPWKSKLWRYVLESGLEAVKKDIINPDMEINCEQDTKIAKF